jgi:YHS domain-containing protein
MNSAATTKTGDHATGHHHMTATDPICGMEVNSSEAAGTSEYHGRTYYFYSVSCKQAFDRDPGAHVRSETHAGHGPVAEPPPAHDQHAGQGSLNRLAVSATIHCLTGCATGEVLGLVIGTALGWSTWPTIALAVGLAFVFGYLFTLVPLVRGGLRFRAALGLALVSDTASIAIMEIVDNGIMLVIPGAMDAGLTDVFFWGSLGIALILAGVVAFPVNRWLIARGRGHAVVHQYHGHSPSGGGTAGGQHAGTHGAHH